MTKALFIWKRHEKVTKTTPNPLYKCLKKIGKTRCPLRRKHKKPNMHDLLIIYIAHAHRENSDIKSSSLTLFETLLLSAFINNLRNANLLNNVYNFISTQLIAFKWVNFS